MPVGQSIKKMGPLKDLIGMMPGANKLNLDALNNVDTEKEMSQKYDKMLNFLHNNINTHENIHIIK